jgi:GntR family transcriptional regulator
MVTINYKDKRPIYEQLVEQIENLIVRGVLEGESRLPSVRSLAVELSLNPNTVQKAYMELERIGYIYSVKGKGNFVVDLVEISKRKKEMIKEESQKIVQLAKSLGLTKSELFESINEMFGEVES